MSETTTITRGAYESARVVGYIIQLMVLGIFLLAFTNNMGPPKPAAGLSFPALAGRVTDQANILTPTDVAVLTQISQQVESKSGAQFVIATVDNLQGTSIEDYGYQLGRHWAIGDKERNDGALLIVAPNEREVRIEVGYGLEGVLTDALSHDIIENTILPAFREGNMPHGMVLGAERVRDIITDGLDKKIPLSDESGQSAADNEPALLDYLAMILFGFIFSLNGILGLGRWTRTKLSPAYAAQLVTITQSNGSGPGGWGGFGGGRGSGRGGGFSGRGGSFGGGGSSGRW